MGDPSKKRAQWEAPGSVPPFFDRFEGTAFMAEHHLSNLTFYNRDETLSSIQRNVATLLNTRATLTAQDYALLDPTTLTYGYPELFGLCDFSFFSPEDTSTWGKSVRFMENALRLFETRLRNARVVIRSFEASTQTLLLTIQADAVIGTIVEKITFPTAIYNIPSNKVRRSS